jgi:integrase
MGKFQRYKTDYPGVYFVMGKAVSTGKPEKIYYIRYRKKGKLIEEKAGRQFQDDMTPARASNLRGLKIEGKQPSNEEKRQADKEIKAVEANKWTIGRLYAEYKKQNPQLKGWHTYESQYEKWLKPAFEKKEPKDIIQLEVDRLRLKMMKKRSPQTVKHVLAMLRRIINYGIKKQLCEGLNFSIEMPSVYNLKTEDLNREQLKSLLTAIEVDSHPYAGPMMKMALFIGLRRGEMFKLQWPDIKFEQGFIHIRDPKGGPDEKVPLNDAARDLLNSLIRTGSPYVFPGRNGGQRVNIAKQVNRIKKNAGLPKDFRPLHGLRHVYASMLASSGEVDIYTLQKLLTHKDPKMTQRYAHLRDEALRKASDVAGKLIAQAGRGEKKKSEIKR